MHRHFLGLRAALCALAGLVPLAVALAAPPTIGSVRYPETFAPGVAVCVGQTDGRCATVSTETPLTVGGKQEIFALATANAAASAATVYGGTYIFNQTCTSYNSGLLTLRYRGPDGATMLSLVSKSAADSSGGTQVALAASTVVDVTLPSGSTGCAANIAKVP